MNTQALNLARLAVASLSVRDRSALIREVTAAPEPQPIERLLRRLDAAGRLGVSTRTIDTLAASGALHRVTLPGRTRGAGFRESEVAALVEGGRP